MCYVRDVAAMVVGEVGKEGERGARVKEGTRGRRKGGRGREGGKRERERERVSVLGNRQKSFVMMVGSYKLLHMKWLLGYCGQYNDTGNCSSMHHIKHEA